MKQTSSDFFELTLFIKVSAGNELLAQLFMGVDWRELKHTTRRTTVERMKGEIGESYIVPVKSFINPVHSASLSYCFHLPLTSTVFWNRRLCLSISSIERVSHETDSDSRNSWLGPVPLQPEQ